MANTLKFGAGQWATKEGSTLAYNDENNNFKPLPFNFERASSATVINKDGLIETVGIGEPRIDYKDDSKGALKLEPQRTNSITYSNDLSQSIYIGDLRTNSVYGELGFNGENDAWRYTKDSPTSSGFINLTLSGTYTISLFIKKEANKGINIYNFGDANQFSKINIENGTYIDGVDTVKIEKFSNDWFRVSQTLTVSNGVWYFYLTDGEGNQITTSILLQNIQIEQGSYATSYIPTQGSAVTRVAESCSQTPPDGIIGQTEGVLFLDFEIDGDEDVSYPAIVNIDDGTVSNRFGILRNPNDTIHIYMTNTSSQFTVNTTQTSGRLKIALAYANNDIAIYVNSVSLYTTNNASIPSTSKINLNRFGFNSSLNTKSNIYDFKLYNTRLSNAELQALTQV